MGNMIRNADGTQQARRKWLKQASAAALAPSATVASFATWAQGSAFPNKPLKLVIPFGAGGSDAIGRAFAEKLSISLKQPVIVENKPGAAALIGSEYVANAPADGYTKLFIGGGSLTPILIKDLFQWPATDQVSLGPWNHPVRRSRPE